MKKLIVTLILGLITVVSFSSCGNSKKDAEKFIVGEWIADNACLDDLDNDASMHLFFNADSTFKGVYENNGVVLSTIKGKYYIVNKDTVATMLINGGKVEKDFFYQDGENKMFIEIGGDPVFFKRANNFALSKIKEQTINKF